MAGVYRPRHPERTVLYRVLFHHFERFLAEYESRFEREYGYFRPIVKEVVERILSWRHSGFSVHSRVRATTKTEAERVGKYMIRPLLALERLSFLEQEGKVAYRYGQAARETETMDYLEFIARVTSHIPDKGQVMVRYYSLYANAHRGKVKKAGLSPSVLRIVKEEPGSLPAKGWAAMIRKVYEVDPMICSKCGGRMKVVAFLTEHAVVDRIIDHLKLIFVAAKPPPPQAAFQEFLWEADPPAGYFPDPPAEHVA